MPVSTEKFGFTLSGGGFRATLFHLGVVRFLYDSRLLQKVTHITSVSGGSILAAHLVLYWHRYTGSEESFEAAANEIVDFVQRDIRGKIVRRWLMMILWVILCLQSILLVLVWPSFFLAQWYLTLMWAGVLITLVLIGVRRFTRIRLLQSSYESLYGKRTLETFVRPQRLANVVSASSITMLSPTILGILSIALLIACPKYWPFELIILLLSIFVFCKWRYERKNRLSTSKPEAYFELPDAESVFAN